MDTSLFLLTYNKHYIVVRHCGTLNKQRKEIACTVNSNRYAKIHPNRYRYRLFFPASARDIAKKQDKECAQEGQTDVKPRFTQVSHADYLHGK
jgi:hypothetical protein